MSAAYETYQININRVKNFISLYDNATSSQGRGRKTTLTTDILRAGVVFLHSTLEEYLRTVILKRKMDLLMSDVNNFNNVLSNVNLCGENSGKSTARKYALSEFWNYKEKTISQIVTDSLSDKVGYMTFNEYSQIIASLKDINISLSKNFNIDGIIDNYIIRRHKIVHEADKNSSRGRGYFQSSSINSPTLTAWITAVDTMITDIESQLD